MGYIVARKKNYDGIEKRRGKKIEKKNEKRAGRPVKISNDGRLHHQEVGEWEKRMK
jgi:hypothetical protein